MNELEQLRERVAYLEALLGARTVFAPTLGLTASEALVLGVILKREIATARALITALDGILRHDSQSSLKTVHVHISRLRRKLKEHNVIIHSLIRQGWFITGEDKEKLRGLVVVDGGVKVAAMFHGKQTP